MKKSTVRMGKKTSTSPIKLLIIFGIIVFVGVVGAVVFSLKGGSEEKKLEGCLTDGDCPSGSLCALGGCAILLSSEHAGIWADGVAAQVVGGVPWSPRSAFGEKLKRVKNCSLGSTNVKTPDTSKYALSLLIDVYEFTADNLVVHQFRRAKAGMWVDGLRFWFSPGLKISQKKICGSDDVDKVAVRTGERRGGKAPAVDVGLRQVVPVASVAEAAIAATIPLPPADAENVRSFGFELEPVFEKEATSHSVLAVPLGADVLAIDGPPPSRQRLLTGYIAYYWTHSTKASKLKIKLKLPTVERNELDLSELNP